MIVSDEQREENFQEYLRLLHDPNYVDVTFDQESGGVSAVHREHKFDSDIGAFGIRKGDYERNSLDILRKRGHSIILESEVAPDGVKTPDGYLDGVLMEIKAVEGKGKWAIKDKYHDATKQGVETLVLYFHQKNLFSIERIDDGWKKYLDDIDSQRYMKTIKHVICINESQVLEWKIPK